MKRYLVKELFYTIQGEGFNVGRAAVFVRFAGCNLWSGHEQHRKRDTWRGGCSLWCDTDFVGTDDTGGGTYDAESLTNAADALSVPGHRFVVLTGGEPALQVDNALIGALHSRGFEVAIETNGTKQLPRGLDWVCVSPKGAAEFVVRCGDELKLIYPQVNVDPGSFARLPFRHFYIQPKHDQNLSANTLACVEYIKTNPQWRLSLQTHKLIGVP
jgi:7-carboxy-7-deazaguanine synthase (Cx14CxxC type)